MCAGLQFHRQLGTGPWVRTTRVLGLAAVHCDRLTARGPPGTLYPVRRRSTRRQRARHPDAPDPIRVTPAPWRLQRNVKK